MFKYRQLTIWDVLDELAQSSSSAPLGPAWDCLDAELRNLPLEAQLAAASTAFNQIAQILNDRANELLQDVSNSRNPDGPSVTADIFSGLVRKTMQLDFADLLEPVTPQVFSPHRPHQYSVAVPVEKQQVLAMLEQITSVEDVHQLAGEEDVKKWQEAIADHLTQINCDISLTMLQSQLQMPLVEVWLGLLLGEFALEQRGEFYETHDVWIICG
jgi:L-rhamnose mutarotase